MIWSAQPSQARSIFPIDVQEGDRLAVWFGRLDGNDRMALDGMRWFAVREGWTFYCHKDSEITTALIRPPTRDSWLEMAAADDDDS